MINKIPEKIVLKNLDDLKEYDYNPRKNDHVIDDIAKNLSFFGFRIPMLIKKDGCIIDGHLRFKAAKKLKLQTVPVIIIDDLSEDEIKAFRLSVNKTAELADWDYDLLLPEIEYLKGLDIDIDFIGFDLEEKRPEEKRPEEKRPEEKRPDPKEKPVKYNLLITLDDEDAQQELFNELNERGFTVKKK